MKLIRKFLGAVLAVSLLVVTATGCMNKPDTIKGNDYTFSITPDKQTELTLVVACQASNER